MTGPEAVAASIEGVRERIARAAARAGRDPSDIQLVAVSKGFAPTWIMAAVEAGQTHFGENRVKELLEKNELIEADVVWHFIGYLQRNKVGPTIRVARYIHSVDRLELASRIGSLAQEPVDVLIEVNVSGEATKGGVASGDVPALFDACVQIDNLNVVGLMTMAPRVADPNDARPYFRRLAGLKEELNQSSGLTAIRHLSMGMSQDYEVAIEEGSTMVRVGEAIFGPRHPI